MCQHDLHSEASLICELCLTWYHLKVGLTKSPKRKTDFAVVAIQTFSLYELNFVS